MWKTGAISKDLASQGPDHLDQAQLVELDGYGVTAGGEQSAITYALGPGALRRSCHPEPSQSKGSLVVIMLMWL